MAEITPHDIADIARKQIRRMGPLSICGTQLSEDSMRELARSIIIRVLAGQSSDEIQTALTAEIDDQLATGKKRRQRMIDTGSYD